MRATCLNLSGGGVVVCVWGGERVEKEGERGKGDLSTKTWGLGFFKIHIFENLKKVGR